MARLAMIQKNESVVFEPLCIIDADSCNNNEDIVEVITEAYRQTIPGYVSEYATLNVVENGKNKYEIFVEISYDDPADPFAKTQKFSVFVVTQYVPTFGHKEV